MKHYRSLWPLLLILSVGCYAPDLSGGGHFRCTDHQCPDGFTCSAGICVEPGSESFGCKASSATPIGSELTTSIGLTLDPGLRHLHVSYGRTENVIVASRELPEDSPWELRAYSPRGVQAGQLGFTSVDALEGQLAVVFDGRRNSGSAKGAFVSRSVRVSTQHLQAGAALEVPYGAGSGAYLAVKQIPGRPQMVVAYRSDNRTQLVVVDHATRQVTAGPLTVAIPEDAPDRAGQFNRLLITDIRASEVEVHVAFVAESDGDEVGVKSVRAYLARATLPTSEGPVEPAPAETAKPLGTLSIDVAPEERGLDLVQDGGLHVAWTEKQGNQTQVTYQAPGQSPKLVAPGGSPPASAGAPALAAQGGSVGLAYIDADGVLWLTVRSPTDGGWLSPLPIEDTRSAAARQAKLAIVEATGSKTIMALAYVNNDRDLRYRTISCTLPE